MINSLNLIFNRTKNMPFNLFPYVSFCPMQWQFHTIETHKRWNSYVIYEIVQLCLKRTHLNIFSSFFQEFKWFQFKSKKSSTALLIKSNETFCKTIQKWTSRGKSFFCSHSIERKHFFYSRTYSMAKHKACDLHKLSTFTCLPSTSFERFSMEQFKSC